MKRPRLRSALSRPMRLPQWLPSRASDDAQIYGFNASRQAIVREVATRVVDGHLEVETDLELLLNRTAHEEVSRLERQGDDEARESLAYWRGLTRKVGKLSPTEKLDTLRKISDRIADDVAGNFDPRVYWLARRVVPRVIGGVMNPPALVREVAGTGRGQLDAMLGVEGHVDTLHRLAKLGTLVYVPTHVSNLDSLALGDSLSRLGLPPVVYGAGKNLFTNPITSFFMHNLGAYRIDRRVRARLYKDVLKAYSCVMIERGFHSLFFPGGTRCRSGMIERHLKLGLAGTAVEAFARGCVRAERTGRPARRIFFVPVTINYGLVLEAESLIEDYLRRKGREQYVIDDDGEFSRLDRWVSFFGKLRGQEGSVILRFARPLDPFGNPVDDQGNSLDPGGRVVDPTTYVTLNGQPRLDARRDAAYTRELGRVLVDDFRRETVIMSSQLVGHLLFRRLVEGTPGVDLFHRLRRRGEFHVSRTALCHEIAAVRDRLLELEAAGEVKVSPFLRSESPQRTLERALSSWGYHSKTVVGDAGEQLVIEDPTVLLYYQNRLVDFAEALATGYPRPVKRAAAEIADLGGRP
jgi:glycerol-3-phosphate O-acyltransferase